jgi:hypothetical protein
VNEIKRGDKVEIINGPHAGESFHVTAIGNDGTALLGHPSGIVNRSDVRLVAPMVCDR